MDRFAGVRDSGRSGASVEMAPEERVRTLQTGVQKLAGCARRTVEVDTHPGTCFDAHDGSSVAAQCRPPGSEDIISMSPCISIDKTVGKYEFLPFY